MCYTPRAPDLSYRLPIHITCTVNHDLLQPISTGEMEERREWKSSTLYVVFVIPNSSLLPFGVHIWYVSRYKENKSIKIK
jgi:hypothetical protein